MDYRMFATGENTCRLPVIDKRDGTMGKRNGSGTVELIEMVFMFFFTHLDPVMSHVDVKSCKRARGS